MTQDSVFWDRYAESYAKSAISDPEAYEYTLARSQSYLSPEMTVLELGCGTASTAIRLAPNTRQIIASDISPRMGEIGARRAAEVGIRNLTIHTGDAFDAALTPGSYDAILAFNLLHLLRDQAETLERIAELLPPGGLFISKTICLPERGLALKLRGILAVLPLLRLFGKAPFARIGRISALDKAVESAGFEIIETGNYPASPPRRYIVARKL